MMKHILTATGFVTFLFSCCITVAGDDKWYVPMLIGLGGMVLVGIAVLIDYREQFKADKRKRRRDRHCDDADKLRQSEDMKNTYNELILNQIWQ